MAPSDPTFDTFPDLTSLFDPPTIKEWREIAEKSLKGRSLEKLTATTHEGIEIAPLATAEDATFDPGYPGQQPFVRGRTALGPGPNGWQVSQQVAHPDPRVSARWAAEDLARGCASPWVVLDAATRTADADAPASAGVRISDVRDLDSFFADIDLSKTPILLTAGGNFAAVAATFIAAARRHGVDPRDLSGSFDCDPLGSLADDGVLALGLPGTLELLAEQAQWTDWHAPGIRTITVSTLPYHLAGANAVQELAYALATAIEYLRILTDHEFEPGAACRQIGFRHAIGRDLFVGAAKLRAMRRIWARAAGACGAAEEERAAPIHAVTAPRGLTTRDPWVNMLRTTVGSFAAAVGGADILTVLPFDTAIGESDELARRMATNSQTILHEESHMGRVVDPGGGSWYIEKLTDELATAAWQHFQTIEAAGGMTSALLDGTISRELDRSLTDRQQAIATNHDPVTGVSSYPNLDEERLHRETSVPPVASTPVDDDTTEVLGRLFKAANTPTGDGTVIEIAIDAASMGATIAQLTAALRATRQPTRIPKLPARRDAEIFEHLRDASDVWLADRGVRPQIFLANMGPVAEHKPRAAFATNFFEAGGIEALGNEGFATPAEAADAFAASDTALAVVCSSDARYPDLVPDLARELEKRGARTVLVAGKPREHEATWREAGVAGFIHMGCDQYRMLVDLLQEEGVLHV